MASETVKLTHVCPGGSHLTFTLSGAKEATLMLSLLDLSEPVTDEEIVAFCKVMIKLVKVGRTNAQARAVLEVGVTVIG